MDIGAWPIVMQMTVLASRPYRYRISADSYADPRVGSAGIHIGSRPIVMQMSVLASRPYRYRNEYRSSADSYADERLGVTTV
jgi:hypothetical protein